MLAPLTPGKHTISFGGTRDWGATGSKSPGLNDVTYNLTVR